MEHFVKEQKIYILGVQEINIKRGDNIETLQIPDYKLIHDNLLNIRGVSRAGIYIHNSIKYN